MSGRYIKFTNYVVNVNNSALSIYRILSSWQNWHSLILSLWTAPAMMVSDHNSLLTYLTLVCKQNDGFETSWTWWKKSQTLCYLSSVVDFMFECWCVCMLLATDLVDTLYPLILMGSKCVFFSTVVSLMLADGAGAAILTYFAKFAHMQVSLHWGKLTVTC